jgi:transcriptional regulator with XRE-family HTH domain
MMSDGGASNVDPSPEERLDDALAQAGLDVFPDVVRLEVDGLLTAGQALEPGARRRFVDAAKRGGRPLALRLRASLEVVLFTHRRERGQSPDEVAATAGIDPVNLLAVERGERTIASEKPTLIALWASALDVDRETLRGALRRSLGKRVSTSAYAGERQLVLTVHDERYVEEVLRAFDQRASEPGD